MSPIIGPLRMSVAQDWPCTDMALAQYWPCTDMALALYWPYTDMALAQYWSYTDMALAQYWPCTDKALAQYMFKIFSVLHVFGSAIIINHTTSVAILQSTKLT